MNRICALLLAVVAMTSCRDATSPPSPATDRTGAPALPSADARGEHPPAPFVITPATSIIAVGDVVQLALVVNNGRGNELPPAASITWQTSDPSVATVTSDGLVTGVAPGSAQITATHGHSSSVATVTVTSPLGAPFTLACTPSTLTLPQASAGTILCRLTSHNSFSGLITLAAGSVPAGVAVVPFVSAVDLPANGSVDIPVAVNVGADVPRGSSTIELLAKSGRVREAATITLTVTANTARVHIVYLVPSDRTVNATATLGMERAIRNLQIFYQNQLGTGKTFAIAYPVVQVINTGRPTTYYQTNPSGQGAALDFWANTTNDGFALTGGGFFSRSDVWVFYIDADPLPGQVVGGTSGVAVLPGGDVRGISGQSTEPLCRWVGGLGHELGHAFGLPHPPECDPVQTVQCPINALMWLGYASYPNAFLTASDKTALNQSPFFGTNVVVTSTLPDCTRLLAPTAVLANNELLFDRAGLMRSGGATPLACGYGTLRAVVAGGR